jgi:hypothetical protein
VLVGKLEHLPLKKTSTGTKFQRHAKGKILQMDRNSQKLRNEELSLNAMKRSLAPEGHTKML